MTTPVSYEIEDGIAVITIDNPPVNALGHAVREGLWQAIDRFAGDDAAKAALVLGEGKLFLGGADISEFGKPPKEPSLPDLVGHIEAAPKPVICAIQGAALGGGLEVALGCHYRVAMPGAKLGLPEVTLGIIPGAGGTQRLPRLVGLKKALEIIPAGGSVAAEEAVEIGLADRLGEGAPKAAGLAYARDLVADGAAPHPVGTLPCPEADDAALEEARAHWARRNRGEVARLAAIDAIEAACARDIADGMAEERRIFQEMIDTPQRAGLIHAFFNERKTAKLPELKGVTPRDVSRIGVIGGGTMGSGIAASALLGGLDVTLIERDDAAAEKAQATVTRTLDGAVKRGKLAEDKRDAILSGAFRTATEYDALSDADLAVEAVFEDMDVKTEVFATLDRVMKPGAVLATNTSYLDVAAIAATTSRPADVIGLHFFSPAHVMKLLEVVVPDTTAPEVTATAFALAKKMGKTAVRAGVCDGFIGNRILSAYRASADRMVLAGASPYEVDRAVRAFGWPMGPYEMGDLAGLDIGYATRQRRATTRDPRDIVPTWADELYHLGRLGQKTGRGYYIYEEGARGGTEDPEVLDLIEKAREAQGASRREFTEAEIQRRYMAALVNEAARVLEEGIAQRPLDIDVTFLYGYGFPRWRGGPMHWADSEGLPALLADIERYAEEDPFFWQPAPLLKRLVAEGRSFQDLNDAQTGDAA
ncbi:3-hydroxyacyl-CoA dehydrogenase NAD-binding domain-containing protein [Roseivivax sediminis]|uniref:3-hydroxyacyl-CoA dehydrogenase n=1 Tax=Roseivivax sediminis TaxID=936889 RepID=A0A1I2C2C0_9RHOB|nr:3-hydroxyacyl-CoA dehydrogenase NAD-binding domain-containing protein [Roseivivax sediminis]SFE62477.1 3-hydroxyacyl-CoA dehydrogenase [Roseivivax sediminis]